MDSRVVIAAAVTGIVVCLFAAAVIASGISEFKTTGHYEAPQYLIDLAREVIKNVIWILGASGVLGGIAEWRKNKQKNENK